MARWQVDDPALTLVVGTALLLAGPVVRFAVRSTDHAELDLPSGPSRFSTLTAASCLSIVKAALGTGALARRRDHLTDRS